ncbi:hypothetical protein EV586_10265 [Tumebacillus sp. BK434]|uniref:hypothetical protein n=1 Tax=Tumebacillus sp. BK434 TaxID=2512169 RepID=UPI001051F9FF|nr:hypothetical protein [Tumebacillus sp. BK434]TCP57621.1 hypothetical protein EV586_10265 [Tumebacillus sp. BK434]
MNGILSFVERMNLLLWLAVIFVFHLVLYLTLGTDNWLIATVLATGTYAAVFVLLKAYVRNNKKRGVR